MRSGVKPIILTDGLGDVVSFLLNDSNIRLSPMMLGPQALTWFPVVLIKQAVPKSFPGAVVDSTDLSAETLAAVYFDAAGLSNPTLALIPMVAFFGYGKEYMDSEELHDNEVQEHSDDIYGNTTKQWMKFLFNTLMKNKWQGYVDVYNKVSKQGLLQEHLG